MRYERSKTGTILLAGALFLGGCAAKGGTTSEGAPAPAASATGVCPDRGDAMPDMSKYPNCVTDTPGETDNSPSATDSPEPGEVKPSVRYSASADPKCGPIGTPKFINETATPDGVPAINGEHCATIVDPATGRVIGSIAANSPYTIECEIFSPQAWKVISTGSGVEGEAILAAGASSMAAEGAYNQIPACE
ncbi:MAG: hypothetical protein ABWY71_02220 [Candidatus Saccharimonadales bacterium]